MVALDVVLCVVGPKEIVGDACKSEFLSKSLKIQYFHQNFQEFSSFWTIYGMFDYFSDVMTTLAAFKLSSGVVVGVAELCECVFCGKNVKNVDGFNFRRRRDEEMLDDVLRSRN